MSAYSNTFNYINVFKIFITILILAGLFSLASETIQGARKDYENVKKEIQHAVKVVDDDIKKLKQDIKTKGTAAVKEETLKDLEKARTELISNLDELEKNSAKNWKETKKTISESIASLHAKVQKTLID